MFLAPLSVPDSAGLDLRNDVRFLALERALEGASRTARAEQVAQGNLGDVALDWAGLLEEAGIGALQGVLLYGIARQSMQPEAVRLTPLTADELEAIAARMRKKGLTVRVSP